MQILELNTGLFPDAKTVSEAVKNLGGEHTVSRLDAAGLAEDDKDGWAAVATAILQADLVVTL